MMRPAADRDEKNVLRCDKCGAVVGMTAGCEQAACQNCNRKKTTHGVR